MIAIPLTHSSASYSMEIFSLAKREAIRSFAATATYGTILATPILLSKEPSTAKETALPLLTAIIVASGISAITSTLAKGTLCIAESRQWRKVESFASCINYLSFIIGSAAGLYFYQKQ